MYFSIWIDSKPIVWDLVVYLSFIFYCMQYIFGLTEWHHACIWKNRELVICDWYFSGRMETTSTKKKGNEREECQNISQKPCVHTIFSQVQSSIFDIVVFFYTFFFRSNSIVFGQVHHVNAPRCHIQSCSNSYSLSVSVIF